MKQFNSKYWVIIRAIGVNGRITKTVNIFCNGDWKPISRVEFANFNPGQKKQIKVFEGEEVIYQFEN